MINTLSVDYSLLMSELHKRAAAARQPANGAFELTERCNLSCRMCYVRHPASDTASRNKELSAEQWLELARQAKNSGMVFLLLTGGEVFLRPDFFEIYMPLTSMGLVLTLFTNGTLITQSIAARIAEAPPSRMGVTLYGATAKTYETITGVKGSYMRCCTGIEALIKYNIPFLLKTTITRQNVDELEAMRCMANDWGVPFSGGWLLSRRIDGSFSDVKNCRLSPNDCVELEGTDNISSHEWNEISLRELSCDEKNSFCNFSFSCYAGKSAFAVTASGKMNSCLSLSQPSVYPLEIGFRAAWEQVQNFVDSAPPLDSTCLACEMRSYCPRCPAWSMLETGTLNKPVPYLCEIARARKEHYVQPA